MGQWLVMAVSFVAMAGMRRARGLPQWVWPLWGIATLGGLVATAGLDELRKIVALLAMPTGGVWILSLVVLRQARRCGDGVLQRLALLLAAGLFLAGNVPLATGLVGFLERPWRSATEAPGAMDAVAVLGGGVGLDPLGRPELARSGDRLRVGVEMVREGRAPLLVLTGPLVSTQRGPASLGGAARTLAVALGVPGEAVLVLTGPRSTSEEIRCLARIAQGRGWTRVGLVTSAWHLNRAMALARRHRLPAVAVPADFVGVWRHRGIRSLVPQAQGLLLEHLFWWEVLGRLAGR